jgi:parvulin-like peptidyl-prolyl isomerase
MRKRSAYTFGALKTNSILWLITIGVLSWAITARADLADAIQAIVHDSVITYLEINALTEQTADLLVNRYRDQPDVLQKELNKTRMENIERQVQNQLILHDFKTQGYNLPDSLLDELFQERLKNEFGDRATATKSLEARGITIEKYKKQIRDRFVIQQLRLKNISQEIIISPHKIEEYYQAHRDDYKVEDQVKLRMIVINKSGDGNAPQGRKLADEILDKLKEGTPFAEMASLYSQGSQRAQGGDWGWVQRSVLRKELAEVAFSLKPGERSDVIETDQSCYLMLVEDTRTSHFKNLSEVRDQIDKELLEQERNRLEKQWIERLKKKTFVRYF